MNNVLERLHQTLEARKSADASSSYSAKLYAEGLDSILKKVGEEAIEVILAAKSNNAKHLVCETADLWFHTMLMLSKVNLSYADVLQELARREGLSGLDEKQQRSSRP